MTTKQHNIEHLFHQLKPTDYNDHTLCTLAQFFTLTDLFERIPYSKLPVFVKAAADYENKWQLPVRLIGDPRRHVFYDVMSVHYEPAPGSIYINSTVWDSFRRKTTIESRSVFDELEYIYELKRDDRIPNTIHSILQIDERTAELQQYITHQHLTLARALDLQPEPLQDYISCLMAK